MAAAHRGIGRYPFVTFNSGAQLDPDQVTDVRGRSYGGGRGIAVGGGGIGLVIAVVYLLLGGNPGDLLAPTSGGAANGPIGSQATQECKKGDQANQRADCRIVGFVNSIQAYWKSEYAKEGGTYKPAQTIIFSDIVDTGCGQATTEVGPFYCPPDETVYIDLGFFDELQSRFGAGGGPLAEGYVMAHEYGHHIQDLEGILSGDASGVTGADSRSVRTELQADCLAGVWVNHASSTSFLKPPTDDQVGQALDAAAAVGDDRIQQKTQGQVDPETWTHGSAAQRQHWFVVGFKSGAPSDCNTFSGPV
jgi:predicted metalloprotease